MLFIIFLGDIMKVTRKQLKIRAKIEKICGNKEDKLADIIKEYLLITIGAIIMAVGISIFLLPNELSTGGVAGIGTILYYVFKMPLGIATLILNVPLLIISFFKINKELFFKSVYGTVILALAIDTIDKITPFTTDKFISCVYGGILVGIGTAIILKVNASTGGSDLLSYVIRVYKPQYRSGNLIFIIDVIIVILNVLVLGTVEIGLYSTIAIYLMSKMIDIIFEGVNFSKVVIIISPKYMEISKVIGNTINRGSTGIYSKGMYTNENKMTLLCVGSRHEAFLMQNKAKDIDEKAFIIILNAREVLGKGFKSL